MGIQRRKWNANRTYLNVDGHIATNEMLCHYPIADKDICYILGFVFDQNKEIIEIACYAHVYHGE